MSTNNFQQVAYGLSQPLINEAQVPIIAQRAPTTLDKAQIGTLWINQPANNTYILTSVVNNLAHWEEVSSGTALTFDTDSGTATPSAGVIHISGGSNINTSGATDVVTVNLDNNVTISGNYTTTGGYLSLPETSSTAGQIILDGNPFMHAYGDANTFLGTNAGNFTLNEADAVANVGIGTSSLAGLTTGTTNTAVGYNAGKSLTTGTANVFFGTLSGENLTTLAGANGITAIGQATLSSATFAPDTTAIGSAVLTSFTSNADSGNTAVGGEALNGLLTGSYNCVIGANTFAGNNYEGAESSNVLIQNAGVLSENNVIRIGTQGTGSGEQNTCFIAGITGATVTGSTVLCSTAGQLGTISSSIRYKENIKEIEEDDILLLKPVSFTFKVDKERKKHYGLIAEEVNEIMPELVLYDAEGKINSIAYHEMPALLLNVIKKMDKRIKELEKK
jgi:hypothetical protein